MCSSPKAQKHLVKPRASSASITQQLSGEQYAEMVRRSNKGYERRQKRQAQQRQKQNQVLKLRDSIKQSPAEISGSTSWARLDALKQSFQLGIRKWQRWLLRQWV